MKLTPLITSLIALSLLAGCGADQPAPAPSPSVAATATPDPTPEPTPTVELNVDELALETVSVGEVTAEAPPLITLPAPVRIEETAYRVITEGTGPVVAEHSLLTVRTATVLGSTGAPVEEMTAWGEPLAMAMTTRAPEIREALLGKPQGSTILVGTRSPDGDTHLTLFVVDEIREPRADGAEVTPLPEGLPTVTRSPTTGEPTVTIPPGYTPTAAVVQPLLMGGGRVVDAGDHVVVQITSQPLSGTVPPTSTWPTGPVQLELVSHELLAEIVAALAGQTVGSQLLVILPEAYGPENPDIEGSGATFVYVIDLLA